MQIKFNKKGIAIGSMMMYLYRFIYATFCVGMLVLLIKLNVLQNLRSDPIEMEVLSNRLYNSPGIMYQDPITQRIYPGIIDMQKFQSKNLDVDIDYFNKRRLSAMLELYPDTDNQPMKLDTQNPIYFNQNGYFIMLGVVGFKGSSGATASEKSYPVLLKDNNKYTNARLYIKILRQND